MTFEVDNWPKVQAKNYKDTNGRTIRVVVIHDMEAPESGTTAESVANYFASGKVVASSTLNIDNNSIVRSVDDNDVAYAAPGANSDGLQLELAGYARQSRAEWLDVYSRAVLENAAKATAQYCVKYGIPVKKLSVAELKAGQKGIVGHVDVTNAYHQSSHTDPGGNFPWDFFLGRVNYWLPYYKNNRSWPKGSGPVTASKPTQVKAAVTGGYTVENVKKLQNSCHQPADGKWGDGSDRAFSTLIQGLHRNRTETLNLQTVVGTKADGIWGPESQKAFDTAKRNFQAALKVHVDGQFGSETLKAYNKARNQFYNKY